MSACLTLVFLSLALSLLGTILYFKRLCMMANALSHTSLLGVMITYIFLGQSIVGLQIQGPVLIIASLISSFLTLFLQNICEKALKAKDASCGFVFTFLFAISIVLVSLWARHTHLAQEVLMGSLEFVTKSDMYLSLWVLVLLALLSTLFFTPTKDGCFDKDFFSITFKRAWIHELMLLFSTSIILTLSFRMIGLVAILGFLTGPVFIAKRVAGTFFSVIMIAMSISAVAGLLAFFIGEMAFEWYGVALPTSSLIVVLFSLGLIKKRDKKLGVR